MTTLFVTLISQAYKGKQNRCKCIDVAVIGLQPVTASSAYGINHGGKAIAFQKLI
jgi:hypothetical protein